MAKDNKAYELTFSPEHEYLSFSVHSKDHISNNKNLFVYIGTTPSDKKEDYELKVSNQLTLLVY